MKRWLAGALLGVVVLAVAVASPAHADKSFTIQSLITTAVANPDGSMEVTEVVTYDFSGGPFNFGIRTFEKNLDDVVEFTASDPLGVLEVIEPSASVSGHWEWKLRQPTSDQVVTYVLQYRVLDAMQVGDDVADLNWQFIGSEHPGVGSMSVTVEFPPGIPPATRSTADTDTTVLRGFAHGPRNGIVDVTESRVVATVTDVPAGQFVEVRAVAPASAFTAPSDGTTKLPSILKEERGLLDRREDLRSKQRLGWILAPVLAVIGLAGTGALWFTSGRELRSREVLGEYWREPLDDPPAIALNTLKRGSPPAGAIIAGTIVDLAQRGYLRITGRKEERFGPDTTIHTFQWMGRPLGPEVLPYERDVLELVFHGATTMESDDLTDWARTNRVEAKQLLDRITKGVKSDYESRGYEQKISGSRLGMLFGLCTLVGLSGIVINMALHNGVGWALVALSVLLLGAGSQLLRNRSPSGVEAAAKAAGLRNFLRDFSQLEDAPVGHLILWERYLVYAVALGVSAQLVQGLSVRVPQVAADPNFALWYIGAGTRFDGFDHIGVAAAAAVSAATPNSSGSGGGFSGGGGGGGGGGGFGAR